MEQITFTYDCDNDRFVKFTVNDDVDNGGLVLQYIVCRFASFLRSSGFGYVYLDLDKDNNLVIKKDWQKASAADLHDIRVTEKAWTSKK